MSLTATSAERISIVSGKRVSSSVATSACVLFFCRFTYPEDVTPIVIDSDTKEEEEILEPESDDDEDQEIAQSATSASLSPFPIFPYFVSRATEH